MVCEGCGSPVAAGDTFCGNCGRAQAAAASPAPLPGASGGGPQHSGAGDGPGPDGAALGQATPNATYLGQRLLYEKVPEAPFDPLTNPRFLLHMGRQAIICWIIYLAATTVTGGCFLLLILSRAIGSASHLWIFADILEGIAAACVFWLLPVPALLSEWKFLADDKGAAGPATFQHIIFALRRRQTPLDTVQIRRLRLPGGETRDYLEVRRGLFAGFISCFSHGRDLYVAWTFWLHLTPARWLLMALARIGQSITHRGTDLYVTLRYESAKAMREAMHSAAREGVDVAAGLLAPQGDGIESSVPLTVTEID